jgi:hypothetical protein
MAMMAAVVSLTGVTVIASNSRLWGDVYRSLTEHDYNNKGNWNSPQQLIEIVFW